MPLLRQIGKLRLYLPGLDTDKPWAVDRAGHLRPPDQLGS